MVIFSRDGRHCDERCYNAKWLGCSCICGGKNHGMGFKHATKTQSGRLDGARPNISAMAKNFEEHFGAKNT